MNILVTGSDGCVGTALKSLCGTNENWIFIKRSDCDLTNKDKTIELIKNIHPDYIVHLAAYVPGFYNINSVASFSDNIRINENVLEASNLSGIERGLFCLSVNMFCDKPSKFPMDESMIFEGDLTGPFSGYAYSKRMLALQCYNYNTQYNRKYFGIIPCNIYGPDDNINSGRLIPNIINNFIEASKKNTDVTISGSGKPQRQFIYSIDLAKIIKYLVLNYTDVKPIICCGDSEITVANLAECIGDVLNFKHQIKFDTSKKDGNLRKTVSNAYLKSIIPNILFTNLKTGLQDTINNMRAV